jgi:hypothetical protein
MGCSCAGSIWSNKHATVTQDSSESPQLWRRILRRPFPRWPAHRIVRSFTVAFILLPLIPSCSASVDNIRLWNVAESVEIDGISKSKSGVQFKIIPGHHGGYISQMSEWIENPVSY